MPAKLNLESLILEKSTAASDTPATGEVAIYSKGDRWYSKDDEGNEIGLGGLTFPYGVSSVPPAHIHVTQGGLQSTYGGAALNCLPRTDMQKWWLINAAANAYQSVGAGSISTNGTLALSNEADSTYVNNTTAAVANSIGGLVSGVFNLVRTAHIPTFEAVIRTGPNITNLRFWIGLFSAAPTNVDDLSTASIQGLGFRFSTVAGDTGWKGCASNGSTQSISNLSGTVEADTRYALQIRYKDGKPYFSVNSGTQYSLSTNLPAETTQLGFAVRVFTTNAAAKSLKISRIYCSFN